MPTITTRDARLAAVLHRQHGTFTWPQADRCGYSAHALGRAVGNGRFRKPHLGVYADTAFARTRQQDAIAATLACGAGSVASRLTAAGLWIPERTLPDEPQVTVLVPRDPRPRGIDVARTRRLTAAERTRANGVAVTSPMRTLVDIAALVERDDLELVLDELWRRKLVTPERLLAYLGHPANAARAGAGVLRAFAALRAGLAPPGSGPETLFLRVVRRFRLPVPIPQFPVQTPYGTRYLDFAYEDERIAIEIDGLTSRLRDRRAFDDFLVRQNLIEQQKWTFRRFSASQISDDPLSVAITLGNALDLVPSGWRHA